MSQNNLTCDICIIGAGSGGLSVASGAAQLGLDVILLERDKMGGDCLNTGCVPSKALLKAAKAVETIQKAKDFGIDAPINSINFKEVQSHIRSAIKTIEPHDSVERFEGLGVHVLKEHGQFIDAHTIKAGAHIIKARKIVIAAGASPAIPKIKGLDEEFVLTNERLFDIEVLPQNLVIIGGGPIGMEMAYAFHMLGAEVSILDIKNIMPHDDAQLVAMVRSRYQELGINIYEQCAISHIEHKSATSHKINIITAQGENKALSADCILVAAGRKANLDGLDLEKAKINTHKNGIDVDARLRTNHKHIYAIGDIIGGPQFTHIAGYHAGLIIQNICFKIPAKVNYNALPWVTYISPELAHTGLTLAQAKDTYGEDKVATQFLPLDKIDRAIAEGEKIGGLSLIYHKKKKNVLSVSILAPRAGEMLPLWSLAINKGLKLKNIASLIVAYPTYSDISKQSASSVYRDALFSPLTRKIVKLLNKIIP